MTLEEHGMMLDAIVAAYTTGVKVGRSIGDRTFDSENFPTAFGTPEWETLHSFLQPNEEES